jgi:3-deoxy-D-manno-octulosonate 8-phosphate phosphatase (KDO 8-P phosphatase)
LNVIRLVVFDVDGTLTPGTVHIDSNGAEDKQFNVVDGLGFRLAEEAGIQLGIISGRTSKAVRVRMAALPELNVMLAVSDKATALRSMQSRLGISMWETAYVGDDLNDLPAFDNAGLKIAVANAASELKRRADYVTKKPGGFGAGREAIEWLLRSQGSFDDAVKKYLERELSNG